MLLLSLSLQSYAVAFTSKKAELLPTLKKKIVIELVEPIPDHTTGEAICRRCIIFTAGQITGDPSGEHRQPVLSDQGLIAIGHRGAILMYESR